MKNVVAHENSLINQQASAKKNNKEKEQLYPDISFTKVWSRKLKKERVSVRMALTLSIKDLGPNMVTTEGFSCISSAKSNPFSK